MSNNIAEEFYLPRFTLTRASSGFLPNSKKYKEVNVFAKKYEHRPEIRQAIKQFYASETSQNSKNIAGRLNRWSHVFNSKTGTRTHARKNIRKTRKLRSKK
jgi:hypothetical protein